MIFTFVNNVIIVRLLGAEESGTFFYALAALAFITTILRFGLENGIIWYTSHYPKRTGSLVVILFYVLVIQLIISFLTLRFIIPEASAFSLLWAVVFVNGNVLLFYLTAFYQVKKMFISINISGVAVTIGQTLILIFLYSMQNENPVGTRTSIKDTLLIMMSTALVIQLIWLAIYFYKKNKADFILTRTEHVSINKVLNYSLTNFTGTILLFLVMRADFYFVEKYCDKTELANYIQMAKIGQMALVFPGLLGGVIFPFSINSDKAFGGKIAFFCRVVTLLFVMLGILFLIAGRHLFIYLLGPHFELIFLMLSGSFAGIYFLSLNIVLISYFEGLNMQKIIISSGLVTLLIIILGDSIMVPEMGYMAAAIVFSVANLAGFAVLFARFKSLSSLSIKEIFLFSRQDLSMFMKLVKR